MTADEPIAEPRVATPARLSLAAFPPEEHDEAFRGLARDMAGLNSRPAPGAALIAEIAVFDLPRLRVVDGWSGAVTNRRTRALLADGREAVNLTIPLEGAWVIASRGRQMEQGSGQPCITSQAEPSVAHSRAPSRVLSVHVPRACLVDLAASPDDAIVRPIGADQEAARLLRGYLRLLVEGGAVPSPAVAASIETHLLDLIALTIGATVSATPLARGRGLAAARLWAAKAAIAQRVADRGLSIRSLALSQALSVRQLQRLFAAQETTFQDFLLARRLDLARRRLASSARHASIAGIALDCGFGDVSYFNRAFKARFGVRPSDARAVERVAGE